MHTASTYSQLASLILFCPRRSSTYSQYLISRAMLFVTSCFPSCSILLLLFFLFSNYLAIRLYFFVDDLSSIYTLHCIIARTLQSFLSMKCTYIYIQCEILYFWNSPSSDLFYARHIRSSLLLNPSSSIVHLYIYPTAFFVQACVQ